MTKTIITALTALTLAAAPALASGTGSGSGTGSTSNIKERGTISGTKDVMKSPTRDGIKFDGVDGEI